MTDLRRPSDARIATLLWASLAALCVWGFWQTGRFHGDYTMTVVGLEFIPAGELVFYMWYLVWGLPAVVFTARALIASGLADVCARRLSAIADRPLPWVAAGSLFALAASLVFYLGVTRGLPLSDDEHAYAFIAKTLLKGRFTNPVPDDPTFFRNAFVLVNSKGWFGKYPIGHPAALAIGEAVGLRGLVVPVLAAISLWLTYFVGRAFFDGRTAFFGALLLLLSPHFVWTHGTQMSQPSSTLCMLLGVITGSRALQGASLLWALASGACWGACVLVRPMPGLLFLTVAPVAFLVAALPGSEGGARQRRWMQLIVAGMMAVALVGLLAYVHFVQSGDPLVSGYGIEARAGGSDGRLLMAGKAGLWATSLGGAALRESFWFLGFPLSAVLLPWARPVRMRTLFWGLLLSLAAYRVLVPKTVMSVTGPIYVTEALPLLALGTVDVLRRWSQVVEGWRRTRGGAQLRLASSAPAGSIPLAIIVAGGVAMATMFAPVQLRVVRVSTELSGRVYAMLAERGATRALVFANRITSDRDRRTWAFHPPSPSPDLDDDVVFVRVPDGTGEQRYAACRAFWQRHMPDRRAFVFVPERDKLHLSELH